MRDGDQRVQAIESFARDDLLHEWIGIFGDGMAQVGSQREKKTDRVNWARCDGYEFAFRARLLPQLKNFVESFWWLRDELSQKVRAIGGDLRCRIYRQSPEAACIPVGFRGRADRITREGDALSGAEKRVQVNEDIVGGGKSYERMIHNDQIVA